MSKDQNGVAATGSGGIFEKADDGQSYFPFLKLPAQIRYSIYRLALVLGHYQSHRKSCWVNISGLGMHGYKEQKMTGEARLRSSYIETAANGETGHTTYTSSCFTMPPCYGILSVNRQIHREASPIFYGENCFNAWNPMVMIPFIKDRGESTYRLIKSLRLRLVIRSDGILERRHYMWYHGLRYIAQHLSLRTVNVAIRDDSGISKKGLRLESRDMRWVHALAGIQGLEELTILWEERLEAGDERMAFEEADSEPDTYELNPSIGDFMQELNRKAELETYLRCLMLKDRTEEDCKKAQEIRDRHA